MMYLKGNNKTAVYRYIENQSKEDMMNDQITIKEYVVGTKIQAKEA